MAAASAGDAAFWEAEMLAGRARLAVARGAESGAIARLWNQALQRALPETNPRIIVAAALAIGFEYAEHTTGFRHLARFQFECLRGAELNGTAPGFLGNNLFRFWSQLDYRRLSENDLQTKHMLVDSAHEMKRAGVREETAAATMVLLLARLFQHHGPATDWAKALLQGDWGELPEDVRLRLATD